MKPRFSEECGVSYFGSDAGSENNSTEVGIAMRKISWPIILFVLALIALILNERAYSSGAPEEPVLRLEIGMHSAWITSIGVDTENKFIVTGSQDKTIRLWELSTAKLVRIFRPPIGEGPVGMVLDVMFSPDEKEIVCGGFTKGQNEKSYSIYFFDRESGNLVHRITGFAEHITRLAYSKDRKFLAVGMGRGGGIRIYRASDYSVAGKDSDYGESVDGVDFDGNGRLVTISYDGFIRLYGNDFKLVDKRMAPEGFRPSSVKFSPDGSSIAVSFHDSAHLKGKLDVLSGKDLSSQYSPDMTGITKGYFGPVSWSLDGKFLYGGKRSWPRFIIRKWSEGGKGSFKDLLASEAFLTRLVSLKDERIVFASSLPSFGVFDGTDKRVVNVPPPIADFRRGQKRFRVSQEIFLVSHDGAAIQFSFERFGKSPSQFFIRERSLKTDPLTETGLFPAVTEAPGLKITDWETAHPRLNGNPIKIWRDDHSKSLAISPEKDAFLLGTNLFLHLFDRGGNEIWKIRVAGGAFDVNISRNGRIAVAALGDGTVRWYRMKDGRELLAFFPHSDKKRWVLWTPSGYYDASPGAEELIGWHVNNGGEQAADFFPVSRFRYDYYRPDMVAKILETLDEVEAIKLANKESGKKVQEVSVAKVLPPVVSILFPKDGSGVSHKEIEVKFAVRSPSGEPVTRVKVLVDGRPIEKDFGAKSAQKEEDIRTVNVTIPEKDIEVSIIAENKYAVSEPATVMLKWSGKVKEDEFKTKPKLYVLAIGVSKYEDKNLALQFAAKDARDFSESFLKQKGGLYRDVVLKVLTDEKATKEEIID